MRVQPKISAPLAKKSAALAKTGEELSACKNEAEDSWIPSGALTSGRTEKNSRLIGSVGKFIAKVPKFLAHTGRFIGATLFGGLSAAVQVAAGSLGLVGMAGLGLAGGLEIREGIKEKNFIKIMSGTGEVVRGAFTGLLSAEHLMDLGRHAGTIAAATATLGVLQGGVHLTSGVLKLAEGRAKDSRKRRVEGMLEMGMGVASLAMMTGPITPLAIGAYAGLSAARFGITNWDKLKDGAAKLKKLGADYWNTMRREFRGIDAFTEDDKPKQQVRRTLESPKVCEPTLAQQCRSIF